MTKIYLWDGYRRGATRANMTDYDDIIAFNTSLIEPHEPPTGGLPVWHLESRQNNGQLSDGNLKMFAAMRPRIWNLMIRVQLKKSGTSMHGVMV